MKRSDKQLGGVYLVIDPVQDRMILMERLRQALDGGVSLLQVWNHWPAGITQKRKIETVNEVCDLASGYRVPVIINEETALLNSTTLAGVHFDHEPDRKRLEKIRGERGGELLLGITCTNNLERIKWADRNGFDYVSFCSMFPSPSVDQCDIVEPDSVRKAKEVTSLPVFISGGLTIQNLERLPEMKIDGVALISGVMNSPDPEQSVRDYREKLRQMTHQPDH